MLLLFFQVYENLLLSPGKNTQSFLERASNKRKYNQKVKSSTAYKKRRYELKSSTAKQVNTILSMIFNLHIFQKYNYLSIIECIFSKTHAQIDLLNKLFVV